MRGLRTLEESSFERFFDVVQAFAEKEECVFFLECGEGRDFEHDDMEGEDLRGWLVPMKQADSFEDEWKQTEPSDEWNRFIRCAEWEEKNGTFRIRFVEYPD